MKQHRFSRLESLIGREKLNILENKTVLVIGLGGVGSYVVEGLIRSSIKNIIIVDYDTVDITNINRQLIALNSTIGHKKIDIVEKRCQDINPNANITKYDLFIDEDSIDIIDTKIDFVVDAIDTIKSKELIIKKCLALDIPFISSMGTGNRFAPEKLTICDIKKTTNDPIARILRKFCKDEHINKKVVVLASTEVPMKTGNRVPGSTAFVPSSAGFLIASYVIKYFLKDSYKS